ncbi:MAG: hypothetical protein ABH816_02795 [Candidatus Levyibacteriota bacterium]
MRKRKIKRKIFFIWFILLLILFCLAITILILYKNLNLISVPSAVNKLEDSKDVQLTKNLEQILAKNNIKFDLIKLASQSSVLVILLSGEEIIFSKVKPLEAQVSSLQFILSRLTIEGKRFSRLDFRFEKPVISLK